MLTKKTTLLLLRILEKISSCQDLHSRWLNTLSFLEYIGLRKILKSLPAPVLSKGLLAHIQEESRHSLYFKGLAQKVAQKKMGFKEHELVAGSAANRYFQEVDQYSLRFSLSNPLMRYLYTTYVVEQRALAVYPLYNEILKRKGFAFSLQSVLNDEKNHRDFVFQKLKTHDPLWEKNLEDMQDFEHQKYFSLLIAVEGAVFDHRPLVPNFPPFTGKALRHSSHHNESQKL